MKFSIFHIKFYDNLHKGLYIHNVCVNDWVRFYHIGFPLDPNYAGVQSINNVFHIVDKVENVCVNQYIFDLIDNVEYVVYALYSSTMISF
jgi:hypothetical protein